MKKYEQKIKKYLKERNWLNLKPADLAKCVSIESAELLEIFQWDNLELEEIKKDKEVVEAIKKELADVMIYCLNMSVILNLDTGKIILDKLKKAEEKYPAHIFKKNNKKSQETYWKIKKEYRRKGKN